MFAVTRAGLTATLKSSECGGVFGASDSGLLAESGGPLVGLIKDVNAAAGAWKQEQPTRQ